MEKADLTGAAAAVGSFCRHDLVDLDVLLGCCYWLSNSESNYVGTGSFRLKSNKV